ncbi:DAO domain-containing protein [Fusarium keratoplasticum]|uniref:DAO domain-containing protein n=1 Tax=Fusarium keratoplasticum TaxID=1328300 RepID=A0ACC0QJ61_9HYPO|nr:DAO domain-containing protein [Fusarium keratoplasticum]KAI8657208.1 DAO domain-containing protein [Fusarium keratoplasticum]KAI8658184.1 DAO domain-containing protein [Fusarium keratoplasticum]
MASKSDVGVLAARVNTPESRKRGPPIRDPGLSFWQQTTRAYRHLQSNRYQPVPSTSPYVVIGTGIAGGLLAYELIQAGIPGKDIVLLEAREAASGASSRNAGHVRPDAFRGFETYARHHGKEQAVKILANERIVLEKVNQFVRKHDVPCDFNYTTTFECCMSPEFAEHDRRNYEAFKAAGGDVSHVRRYTGEEATSKTRIAGVLAAYEWPAGSSHPAKLAQWLLDAVVDKGAQLYTFCPAAAVTKSSGSQRDGQPQLWDIQTPRGVITTPKVVYCTNAFTGHLLPQLASYIIPYRGQAHAIIPVPSLTGDKVLTSTYSLRYSLNHYYSIIQRQSDGTVILGCSLPNPALPKSVIEGIRTIDDTYFNDAIKQDAFTQLKALLPDAGLEKATYGEGLVHAWNGIVGLTSDEVPFLGPVPGKPGQFVCAGFNGHGMARIFTCAPGVAQMMLGKPWADTGLPECFAFDQERIDKLSTLIKPTSKI